jgi:hypothetical protein
VSEYEYPPDVYRLRTLEVYLERQLEAVRKRLAWLDPPEGWYLQHLPSPVGGPGRGLLHRGDCWGAKGTQISREDARLVLDEEVAEMCEACRPQEALTAG